MVIEVRPVQPENVSLPIEVTVSGMVIEVRPVHPKNAELPILVTVSGISILVNLLQFLKDEFPIEVSPKGNETVSSSKPLNAESPMIESPPVLWTIIVFTV